MTLWKTFTDQLWTKQEVRGFAAFKLLSSLWIAEKDVPWAGPSSFYPTHFPALNLSGLPGPGSGCIQTPIFKSKEVIFSLQQSHIDAFEGVEELLW